MALADAVPLYLTLLMIALAAIALIGGNKVDQQEQSETKSGIDE